MTCQNGRHYYIYRRYRTFHEMQQRLEQRFLVEAGSLRAKDRTLPCLPGETEGEGRREGGRESEGRRERGGGKEGGKVREGERKGEEGEGGDKRCRQASKEMEGEQSEADGRRKEARKKREGGV